LKKHTLWVVTPVVDLSCITLGWLLFFFAYGTSFAHFVLDGLIWKLRRPKVAREVGTA